MSNEPLSILSDEPCPAASDGVHSNEWWGGGPCRWCGADDDDGEAESG